MYALSWFDYFLFGREDALPFCCLSAALHNGPCGTDGEAITAMQAVLLPDDNGLCADIIALLRALAVAQLTADALVRHKISLFYGFRSAKGKTCPFNRLLGQVKPFAVSLIYLEYHQRRSGSSRRIDFVHIRVLLKQPFQPVRPYFPHLSAKRYGNAMQGIRPFHPGQ